MLTNSVWGLLALVMIVVAIFVKAGGSGAPGTDGGDQAAKILTAAGGSGSAFVTALEGG
jgi:hypothetical protein